MRVKYYFSPFDEHENINNTIRDKLAELSQKLEDEKRKNEANRSRGFIFSPAISERLTRQTYNLKFPEITAELRAKINNERELIDQLIVKVERQAKRNMALIDELKNGGDSVNLVSCSIIAVLILFFAGVIYPLSFLPWDARKEVSLSTSAFWDILFSLRGFMLTLISVIFSALMLVFFFINLGLKHSTKTIEEITFYSEVSNYPIFLYNYIKNIKN